MFWSKISIADNIRQFLADLPDEGMLLMASFGLDEIVLKKLLEDADVPKDYQIYVFYDTIKHLNPGFLCHDYPNTKLIGIRLNSSKRKKFRWPVFHSKVWMVLARKWRICRLAVHSINLTRYHLSSPEQTIESFWFRKNLDLPLPRGVVFQLIRKRSFHKRIKRVSIPPETWIVEEYKNSRVSIKCSPKSVGDIIRREIARNYHEQWIMGAAPFVNIKALTGLDLNHEKVPIRYGSIQRKGRTLALHAKVLIRHEKVITGSANFTQQALMVSQKPINHETILVINRPGKPIIKVLEKFPKIKTGQETGEIPGEDPEIIGIRDWEEKRRLTDKGPEAVILDLNVKRMQAIIRIQGKLDGARYISLKSKIKNSIKPITLRARKGSIMVPKKMQSYLVEIIPFPPIEVEGKRYPNGKCHWYRELDLGSFWMELPSVTKILGSRSESRTIDHKKNSLSPPTRNGHFIDIREIRDRILSQKAADTKWLRWFLLYQKQDNKLHNIPYWIHELKKRVDLHA